MGILQGGRDELGRSKATQNLALEAATSAGLRSSPTTTPRSGGLQDRHDAGGVP